MIAPGPPGSPKPTRQVTSRSMAVDNVDHMLIRLATLADAEAIRAIYNREVTEADGQSHEVLTGEYASWVGSWAPGELMPGRELPEPVPLFRKLDPGVAEEELTRMSRDVDAG